MTYGVVSRFFVKMSPEASPAQEGANRSEDDRDDDDSSEVEEVSGNGNGEWVREVGNLSLLQAYDLAHPVTSEGSHMSDLDLGANLFPTSIASFGSGVGYNPQSERITAANVYMTCARRGSRLSSRSTWGVPRPVRFMQITYNFVGGNAASHTFERARLLRAVRSDRRVLRPSVRYRRRQAALG